MVARQTLNLKVVSSNLTASAKNWIKDFFERKRFDRQQEYRTVFAQSRAIERLRVIEILMEHKILEYYEGDNEKFTKLVTDLSEIVSMPFYIDEETITF